METAVAYKICQSVGRYLQYDIDMCKQEKKGDMVERPEEMRERKSVYCSALQSFMIRPRLFYD